MAGKRRSSLLTAIGVTVVLLPVVYFFSIGPVVALHQNGWLPPTSEEKIWTIYEPVVDLMLRAKLTFMDAYMQWWVEVIPVKK